MKFSTLSKSDKEMCEDIGILARGDDFSAKLLKEIFEENENLTPSSDEIMVTYLYSILFKLTAESRRRKHTPSKYIEVASYSAPVKDTIRFLENNFANQLALDDIVEQTNVKKSYLCSLFKQETSITIFECLMIIRIRKAVELLTYTDLSLAQISQSTGFVNLTHFNRVFTKHMFLPPGQFRKHIESQGFYWKDFNARENASPIAVAAFEGKKLVLTASE
jgi:AraC-type DNA-binding domain-containing proteins